MLQESADRRAARKNRDSAFHGGAAGVVRKAISRRCDGSQHRLWDLCRPLVSAAQRPMPLVSRRLQRESTTELDEPE
jgi:hypothetical protein